MPVDIIGIENEGTGSDDGLGLSSDSASLKWNGIVLSHLTFLCFSFFICNLGMLIPTSYIDCDICVG